MQCPFKHVIQRPKASDEDESKPALSCPVPPHDASNSSPMQVSGGICPLGFSSGMHGNTLSPLSCSLCRSILHEATRLSPCQHTFCSYCVLRLSDCPACGRDIESRSFDEKLDQAASASIKQAIDDVDSVSLKAKVYLELGSQSLAAGNHQAALHRLKQCSSLLRTIAADSKAEVQLGAVLGMQGDCKRKAGQADEALDLYQEAVRTLEPHSSGDDDAARLLAISHNKAGDLCYMLGDHLKASEYYASALEIRRSALKQFQGPITLAFCSLVLDFASSLIKLGDVILAAREEGKETSSSASLQDPLTLFLEADRQIVAVEKMDSNMEGWGAIADRTKHLRLTLTTLQTPADL